MGPLDCVSVVGSVQFVGDQLEGENLFVDLDIRSGDVNLHLWIAFLGCQAVANNLKKPVMRNLEEVCVDCQSWEATTGFNKVRLTLFE